MGTLISLEFLKIKRKGIWFLVFLGPFGVVALQAANFGLRYEWLTAQYAGHLWEGLLSNIGSLGVPALIIGSAIITSMLANIEHQSRSWKQWLALPIKRWQFYLSKLIVSVFLLFMSTMLLAIGAIVLGIALDFGTDIPYDELAKYCVFPTVAGLPIILSQLWLAVRFSNQSIAISIGVLGTVVSLWAYYAPLWLPWVWPYMPEGISYTLLLSTVVAIIIMIVSIGDFVNREVRS
ncbi:ABC transporter permease [Bacillus litorisediminis]|uniref:ABC transporter permease n=1 Tax=Bacillus litorisediminis TaxID=2922713 RepID=UPI001FB01354|nr:ABC transporter permease [Bacillus litorisediminis]